MILLHAHAKSAISIHSHNTNNNDDGDICVIAVKNTRSAVFHLFFLSKSVFFSRVLRREPTLLTE